MTARGLAVPPQEGMEVVATGRLTTFPASSKYQLVIEEIAPAGVGALMAMLEKRRQALAAEGLFDAARKRPLPYLPAVIGVITSPTGAVIRDILHRLRERFPRPVLLWPVTVQGERCAPEVAAAIRGFNALAPGGPVPRPDLLIVARGGGSLEDLWGFNEEIVVRAAAESRIPLISAVGHETDTTLIDFVADRRAPTPTAAAEMAVPVRLDLVAALAGLEHRRRNAVARHLLQRRQRLRDLGPRLCRARRRSIAERAQRLDGLGVRLPLALVAFTRHRHLELEPRTGGPLRPGTCSRSARAAPPAAARGRAGLRPGGDAPRASPGSASGWRPAPPASPAPARRLTRDARAGPRRSAARSRASTRTTGSERGFAIVRDEAALVLTGAAATRGAPPPSSSSSPTAGSAPARTARPAGAAATRNPSRGRCSSRRARVARQQTAAPSRPSSGCSRPVG